MGFVIATATIIAEKVALTLAAKSITDGVTKILKKSPEEKVAKAFGKALDKVAVGNEFWKSDVKRQVEDVIRILIRILDNPCYLDSNPLPPYLDERTIQTFKDCLKEDPEAWDYIQNVHFEDILQGIRVIVRDTNVVVHDTNDVAHDTNTRLKGIEEKLSHVSITPIQQIKHIKVFLASSIAELDDERLRLADYINNTVAPILNLGGWHVSLFKCNDDPSANYGGSSQEVFDKELLESDISVFLFKKKAGENTIHEFDLARGMQSPNKKKHGIFIYCFDVSESEKSDELIAFQHRLEKEKLYWNTCKDINSLESHFLPGLLKHLLGESPVSVVVHQSIPEADGDARFKEYENNEEKQAILRKKLHKDIESLIEQIKNIINDESINIAVRITKVIELYKKADRWAAATAYDKEKYSDLLYDYAGFLYKYGLYKDAETVFLRQIAIAEELYGKEDEKTATSYNYIGEVYREQGYYDKAMKYHLKALEIREKVFGANHPDIAQSYNNIGELYHNIGKFDKALKYYLKSLEIREKIFGANYPDTAQSYNNIGGLYHNKGNFDKALEYYFKALEIRERTLGTKHPATSESYNNIGGLYHNKGNFDKALEYYFKALEIVKEKIGEDHPNAASLYNNIGWIYSRQHDYETALDYYAKAYQILNNKLGEDHLKTKSIRISIDFVKNAMKSSH